jgi:transketolase
MEKLSIEQLENKAQLLRCHIIRMLTEAGSGHTGGSLSMVEVVTALYFRVLRHNPSDPTWLDRDRFVLSKGHGVPALYAVLAEAGYFPVEELMSLRKVNSRLQGHPSSVNLPALETSTGPLGLGISVACGIALAAKRDHKNIHVYSLIGDGECDEGQVWEAAMAANKYTLNNLTVICDRNRFQLDGAVDDIMPLEPFADKWRAFGWTVREVDGHNMGQVVAVLEDSRNQSRQTIIIAHTTKGKGVSFMENNNDFHGRVPTPEEAQKALKILNCEES